MSKRLTTCEADLTSHPAQVEAQQGSASHARLLLVNYHYIRDPALYRYPGIHPMSPQNFGRQIDQLRAQLHVADPAEVEGFVLRQQPLARPSVFITFDDGLTDHWRTACDILDPLGIKAAFFVCSRPALEGRALTVHKIHWLRAHTPPDDFAKELFSAAPVDQRELDRALDGAAERMYIYDEPQAARLKFALNFVLPSDVVDDVTSQMLYRRGIDEAEFCRETYMTDAQLRALTERGHLIGLHGHSHVPFRRLGAEFIDEVKRNQDYIASACGVNPGWVSYPNGRPDAIPDAPLLDDVFDRLRLTLGFTTLGTWNDGSQNPKQLNRINTNEVDAVIADSAAA